MNRRHEIDVLLFYLFFLFFSAPGNYWIIDFYRDSISSKLFIAWNFFKFKKRVIWNDPETGFLFMFLFFSFFFLSASHLICSCSIKSCIHRVLQDCSCASRRYWNIIIEQHTRCSMLRTIAFHIYWMFIVNQTCTQRASKIFFEALWPLAIQWIPSKVVINSSVCVLLGGDSRFILIALNYMIACEIRLFSSLQSIIKFLLHSSCV